MPKITYHVGAPIDVYPWLPINAVLDDGTIQPPAATRFAVTDPYGNAVVFTGNFTITGGVITAGTVTGFTALTGGTATMTGSGYAISATDLVAALKDAIDNNDDDALWNLVWYRPLVQVGSAMDDELYGPGHGGTLDGQGGNDELWGWTGNEIIKGGAGNDALGGGPGFDHLSGGSGKDVFWVYEETAADRIMDFSVKDDTVALDIDYFGTLGLGFVAKAEFHVGKKAATASQHLIYDKATGGLFYDADGNGAAAQVKILQIGKDLALTAHDFIVLT